MSTSIKLIDQTTQSDPKQPTKQLSAKDKFLTHKQQFTDYMIRNNDAQTQ